MAGQDSSLLTVDPLNLATLYLCNVSYARDILTIPGLVQNTPILTSGGLWTCLWGPVQSSDESNLAFVAGYSPEPGLAVQSICVTIRGTDIYWGEDIWGVLAQVWEDIDAPSQVPLPWEGWGNKARIAQGTRDGLKIITGLTDEKGVSLEDFLNRFFATASNSNVTSLVTGHSLGACLATVVAPWIESIRPASYKGDIQPITFAGPTAGNADFADSYSTTFKTARRFQNTLDIIPLALENLPKIMDIYSRDGLDAPDLVWILVPGMSAALILEGVSYEQPRRGTQMLSGIFQHEGDWYAEALHQHHPATYLSLLMRTPVQESALPRSARSRGREARLAKRIGSFEEALKRWTGAST
jgi:triacylglycerol lipase